MDFYDGQIDFEPALEKKVKPFSWEKAFTEVFKQGGFDAVIGNPPYVRQELLSDFKNYFQRRYKVYHGMADLYSYFFEKGIGLLNNQGLFGIIVANKWMRANYGEPLRKWLKTQPVQQIIDFGDLPVFQSATTYPCIFIAGTEETKNLIEVTNVKTLNFKSLTDYVNENKTFSSQTALQDSGWNLGSEAEQLLLKKLQSTGIPLGEYVKGKIYRGVLTGLNEAFVIDEETKNRLIKEDKRSKEIIKPFLIGREVKKYTEPNGKSYLILFPKGFTNKAGNHPRNGWNWLEENYFAIAKYLKSFEEKGKKRIDQGEYWWELRACDYYGEFDKPKIIYPNICKQPEFTYDTSNWYTNQKCFIISLADKYLLGILNSQLINFLFEKYLPKLRGGFYEPSYVFFKDFPIKKVDVNSKAEKLLHDEIVKLVETMLQLQKEKQTATLPNQQQQLEQRIAYTDNKINEKVYTLYGLTDDEIKIVEGEN